VQIETPAALAAIPDIAAVEGVDGIFIGPNDLAANMGHLADAGAPAVRSAIGEAVARIKAAGKAPGILDFNEERAKQLFAAGCVFIAVNGDASILSREMGRVARAFRRS
jgi:4-hydroxy-2-oxoheptanedioate aldolase